KQTKKEHLLFKNVQVTNEVTTSNFRIGLEKTDFSEILKEYCPNKAYNPPPSSKLYSPNMIWHSHLRELTS
ncbi:hypothetical protein LSH36_17g13021, partial [Paralvinella palmiformis]